MRMQQRGRRRVVGDRGEVKSRCDRTVTAMQRALKIVISCNQTSKLGGGPYIFSREV